MKNISKEILNKNISAAAKLMRYIEEEDIRAIEELKHLYSHKGNSYVIGITGLPGSGKSSLIDVIIDYFRKNNKTVGVIAIDPTSPFTGGSILGDRIRMQKHSNDNDVFIKSLPTKGWKGGISKVTSRMITVMEAMDKDIILVETAGVGQTEVEIKDLVHTTIVVLVGGLGDSIQIVKAGILEIADIFVVNKADKISSQDLESDLNSLLSLDGEGSKSIKDKDWKPPVCITEATNNKGIDNLVKNISLHEGYLKSTGKFDEYFKNKSRNDLKEIISDYLTNLIFKELENNDSYKKLLNDLNNNESDPYTVAEEILQRFLNLKNK
ncbi:methylmalonyl Co-A mutase-associated GTPase MeaB [bacterium]|nr:methylmalonyl Co-A mutase-associated GTPase MeaB [bacterium]